MEDTEKESSKPEWKQEFKPDPTRPKNRQGHPGMHTPEARKKAAANGSETIMVKNAIYEHLKQGLLSSKKGSPFYQQFIDKYLSTALKDINSKPAQTVAGTIFSEKILQMLDEEHAKEMAEAKDFQRYRLIKDFFQQQRDVILETNHQKHILVCCSRRAGKTDMSAAAIVNAALTPNSRIIYINLTFTNAIRQIWDKVIETSGKTGLIITSSHKNEGDIIWHNGSSLRIMGNSNNSEIDKLRGESQVSLVVIDEFFHQRNMAYGIDEVISPLLTDRRDSTILCMGTPPRIANTYGEKCWNEKGWKKYHWTMFDNPYIPDPEGYIQQLLERKGITIDAPFIQREYFGKIGVYDTEALVFRDRTTYNTYDDNFPVTDITIGVDYGDSAYNAIVTLVYNRNTRESYVVKEDKFNRAGVEEITRKIIEHYNEAVSIAEKNRCSPDIIKIFADTNAEAITRDLMKKHHLPAYNTYKYDKTYAIELLVDELRSERMKIPHNGLLDEEMRQILWQRDEDDNIVAEFDEEIGIHPDIMMALLYASRKMYSDFKYDIKYQEIEVKTSDYIKDSTGTIIDYNDKENDSFEDMGVIG